MSVSRSRSRLRAQIIQYGAIAALGALAIGAKRPGAPSDPSGARPALSLGGQLRLPHGEHPLARPEFDVGRLDASKRLENLSIVFKLSAKQAAERDALLESLSNPKSAQYRQFLTPEGYAARFGAKPADIARATEWLQSQGLTVSATPSRLGARINFGGTVANIEAAFRSEMHQYKVGKETHYAMASAPSVPASLSDIVLAVHNTHDFYTRPAMHRTASPIRPDTTCPTDPSGIGCREDAGGGQIVYPQGIAPPDWTSIYNANPLYTTGIGGKKIDGTGVTIAIVGTSEIWQSDLTTFWTKYGLTNRPNIVTTLVPGTGPLGNQGGSAIEAVLDTEWAGAIAPGATINYVTVGTDDGNVDDGTYYAIENNLGGVLSESWGGCEAQIPQSDADVVQVFGSAANILGITYLAASGDQGAADCIAQGVSGLYVNIPASYPGVTAVGGTGFATTPPALTFDAATTVATGYPATAGAEAIWSSSNDPNSQFGVGAGGGGISLLFPRPFYQTQTSAPTCDITGSLPVSGITASAMRQVPDVSFTAAGGGSQYGIFIECTIGFLLGPVIDAQGDQAGDCVPGPGQKESIQATVEIAGTSASTPAFAGVVALANQAAGGRLGNINPLLYALPAADFHDVTSGDNKVVCTPGADPGCPTTGTKEYGFAAGPGYDCASGLGSVDATKLVTAIASLTPTTTTLGPITSPLTVGTAVPLTATVAVTGTTNTAVLGGTVSFAYQAYLANGDIDPNFSSTLGTAAISGGTATGGTASPSPSFAIPPGLINSGKGVDVVAMYGGDATHLPSVSPKVHVTFTPDTVCISPSTTTAALGATVKFTTTGGTAPFRWFLEADSTSTADDGGQNGSQIDETSGVLTIGTGQPGYVEIIAIDANGVETFAEVTVGTPGADAGPAPWEGDSGVALACAPAVPDAGTTPDSGPSASTDGGPITTSPGGTTSSSGCSCTSVGGTDTAPAGALGGLVLGLGLIARRRRSRK
jgi:MYXO-CTERM domain-containing protein